MKLKVFDQTNAEKGTIDLPPVFSESLREDLIKRAVFTIQANTRQPYGADPMAGKKVSAELSRRRRKYRGSYGSGISRVPRKVLSRNGTRLYWVGAFAPGTVGGRRAHAPKASKIWAKQLNVKERQKAVRSAIAATMQKDLVTQRGHIVPASYPFALDDGFEAIKKTSDVKKALLALGLKEELVRASKKTIRAGKSRLRGRRYRKRKGPLFVVHDKCSLITASRNIPGVDVMTVESLNAELLAPGAVPGRLTLFTKSAIERLARPLTQDVKKIIPKKDKVDKKAVKKQAKKEAKVKAKSKVTPAKELQSKKADESAEKKTENPAEVSAENKE